jgi:hypothetical protein
MKVSTLAANSATVLKTLGNARPNANHEAAPAPA